jgi:hypothetical protein
MKVLYCRRCKSLVRLTRAEVRKCKCGRVQGQYLDKRHAEHSENADTISIAIANDSLAAAIKRMQWWEKHRPESTREDYKAISNIVACVRPNSGPGNPHSNKPKSKLKNKRDKQKS